MMTRPASNVRFAFFGTSHIAVNVLEELKHASLMPELIVTLPEKKKGRGLDPAKTDVAAWAAQNTVTFAYDWERFEGGAWDVAIVVDYGKILPRRLLDIPEKGFLNMHPSLLPRLRGPSPMRSAILNDERGTGVSVMLVDEKMDHGPIIAQKKVAIPSWPPRNSELEEILSHEGGKLLAQILPSYLAGDIEPHPQNDDVATYSKKFSKEDGLLDLSDDPYKNLLKIRAFEGWPGTYAFYERGDKHIRVNILDAEIVNRALHITTVVPEGKSAMPYDDFLRSGARAA